MVKRLALALLLTLTLCAPLSGAAGAPVAAIAGYDPYLLGAGMREVLRADPELSEGRYPVWSRKVLTRNYGRSMVAPFGGVSRIASLGVQFWQGRLAVVIVKWSPTTFDSASEWRRTAAALHAQIIGGYARSVVASDRVTSPWEWTIEMADAQGNQLSASSSDRPLGVTIAYLWAPYVRAIEVDARSHGL